MFVTFSLEILGTVVQCSEGEKFQKVKCLHYMPFTSGDFVGNKSSKLLALKLLCEGDLILGGFVKHREDSCWKVLGCLCFVAIREWREANESSTNESSECVQEDTLLSKWSGNRDASRHWQKLLTCLKWLTLNNEPNLIRWVTHQHQAVYRGTVTFFSRQFLLNRTPL